MGLRTSNIIAFLSQTHSSPSQGLSCREHTRNLYCYISAQRYLPAKHSPPGGTVPANWVIPEVCWLLTKG